MYNHADEWGGAFYSWASNTIINRCIFMNNTGGTNGGAVMISGNITLTNSIIVNNTSNETGESFYIQQPMFDAITEIDIHNNLITNNTSPLGKEIFIKWKDTKYFYPDFNGNDWGDEDPTDSEVIDPNHITARSKVTSTKKSNLLNEMSLDLLNKYADTIKDYFPNDYFSNDGNQQNDNQNPQQSDDNPTQKSNDINNHKINFNGKTNTTNQNVNVNGSNSNYNTNENLVNVNGTNEAGLNSKATSKASEIFRHTSEKNINPTNLGVIIFAIIAVIALIIGYKRNSKKE